MHKHNLDFHVSGILTNPEEQWDRIKRASMGKNRVAFRKIDVDWKKYNTKDYLFTHDTACCSVETEENGYWITPPCWELVNANGNAWTTPVLLASFKTFIGGENFLEHVQIPTLSKGKILDAIARPVVHHSEKYGDANIYVVDCLVATSRKHEALIERIESGRLKTLSMGTICNYTTCSICGKVIGDNDRNCEHLDNHLGQLVTCQDGKERICAELCGAVDENGNYIEDSNKFIELSWVEHPAFQGAVINSFVENEEIKTAREEEKEELAKLFDGNLFERLKVADTDSKIALKITKEIGKVERISSDIMKKI
jgi:hypothetical protein